MKTKYVYSAVALLFFTSAAFAATTPASSTESKSWLEKMEDATTLTYFGVFRGGPLSAPFDEFQPAVDGTPDETSPQSMESLVTAGYRLSPDLVIGVNAHFFYAPAGVPAANNDHIEMLDPSLMISKANLIKTAQFSLKGMFYVELPTSTFDQLQKHDMLTAFSPTWNADYRFKNSKWDAGLYGYLTIYVPGENSVNKAPYRSYKLYMAPYANYQATDKFAGTIWVDLVQGIRKAHTKDGYFGGMDNYTMDIEPGFSYEFVKNFTINPMINIYPGTPTMNASSIQAVLSGKFW